MPPKERQHHCKQDRTSPRNFTARMARIDSWEASGLVFPREPPPWGARAAGGPQQASQLTDTRRPDRSCSGFFQDQGEAERLAALQASAT